MCPAVNLVPPELWTRGAISFARLRRLYYGASDPKSGGVAHGPRVFTHATCHHAPDVYDGLGDAESAELLRSFFGQRRL